MFVNKISFNDDSDDVDKSLYIEKTKDAICWLNKLKNDGEKWDLYNPVVEEMYPNMANKNDKLFNLENMHKYMQIKDESVRYT